MDSKLKGRREHLETDEFVIFTAAGLGQDKRTRQTGTEEKLFVLISPCQFTGIRHHTGEDAGFEIGFVEKPVPLKRSIFASSVKRLVGTL